MNNLIKYILNLLLLTYVNFGISQNEANVWYFGDYAGLDFNSGSPVTIFDGALITHEGVASICDAAGDILFYTDGSTVYNRNHQVMQNGTDLDGHWSAGQSCIIVPKPNTSNIYYIFTVGFTLEGGAFKYSEVDMDLDGGLGAVTSLKNELLFEISAEKVTAVKNEADNTYWVMGHKWNSDQFYAYRVTAAGVNLTPVISSVGTYIGDNTPSNAFDDPAITAIGQMKFSPDGTRIATATAGINEIQLFDFDVNTGVVSNAVSLDYNDNVFPTYSYGVEFSPNGEILYVGEFHGGLYQYNLMAGSLQDIIDSKVAFFNENFQFQLGSIQLGPDGKVYIAHFLRHYMHVIHDPNVAGLRCNFEPTGISLGDRYGRAGLPSLIQSYFNVAIQTENVCLGESTNFSINMTQPIDSIYWDFGDGNSSSLENPTHTYIDSGEYLVSVTVTSGTNTTTNTRNVTIYEQPTATNPSNIIVCDDDNDGLFDFDLTAQNAEILNGQSASIFEVVYFESIEDYDNGNPIVDPSNYINDLPYTEQNILASVRNINNSECSTLIDFNIQVFDSPFPLQDVQKIEVCDNTSFGTDTDGVVVFDLTQNENAIMNGQSLTDFEIEYYSDVLYTNEISTPESYTNTNSSEIIYVRVLNVFNQSCIADTYFEIEVLELPTVSPIVELMQCDDDLDGFSVFNLTEVNAELSVNYQNETITFYETQTDANSGNNPITNEIAYTNQTVSIDTIWARVENVNGCHSTAQVNLMVSTTQIPSTFTQYFYECDDGNDTADGVSTFDFSSVNTEIQAMFPVGQQLIINYYRNLADALSETNPIIDISNYQNVDYPNSQDIFIRVDSALNNDCLGLGHHITLHVEPVPIANAVTIAEQCDDDGDGMYAFDTSNIENQLLNGLTNVDIEYVDGLGNSLSSPLPNPFLTGSQTITARVTNTSSQDPDGACFDETQITFTVDATVVAYSVPDFIECDNDNDGQFAFNTTNIEASVLNGQTGMVVTYVDEDGNALPSPLPSPFTTDTQTITVRVENQLSAVCYDETIINFIVSEQPTANPIANDFVCDDIGNDGEHTFTLSNYDSQLLNGQSQTTFEVFYFDNNSDAQNNTNALTNDYLVNSTSQTVFARIQNINNPNCFEVTSFELGVHFLPIANEPEDILICDDETNDGLETFDLSIQNITILNGQSNLDNTITYHSSLTDAEHNTNALSADFTNTESPQTIYVRLENNVYPDCYTTTSFQVIVNEQPVLDMEEHWPICEGDTVEIIADSGYDEYLWSTGETSQSIIVDTAGTYEVTATNIYGNLICSSSKTLVVANSNIATITDVETVDWTQNNNVITVFVEGNGNYEYSLDGFIYQDSNEFSNLIIDDYTIYVRDKNGCGIATESVYLLYYPKFFTPNNDGYNDTWQIINSIREPNNKIYIFDRYGKLLKQLSPMDAGWDGTLNGNQLPSNDYWFLLKRQNGKTYRGHFTLKR